MPLDPRPAPTAEHVALIRSYGSEADGKPELHRLTPRLEAVDGGGIAKLRDGDIVRVDAEAGIRETPVEPSVWTARTPAVAGRAPLRHGVGRKLFATCRADAGASVLGTIWAEAT